MPYYAVLNGFRPGVYDNWRSCQQQVSGYSGNMFRRFETKEEAYYYFESGGECISRELLTPARSSSLSYSFQYSFEYVPYFYNPSGRCNVWVNGVCIPNGRHGPCAGIGVCWGPNHPKNISQRLLGEQSSVRAEIMAAIVAIETAKDLGITKLKLHTHSQWLIDCVHNWIPIWRANAWKDYTGKEVKNRYLLNWLDETKRGISVLFTYVPAFDGDQGNTCADLLAKQGALKPHPIQEANSCPSSH